MLRLSFYLLRTSKIIFARDRLHARKWRTPLKIACYKRSDQKVVVCKCKNRSRPQTALYRDRNSGVCRTTIKRYWNQSWGRCEGHVGGGNLYRYFFISSCEDMLVHLDVWEHPHSSASWFLGLSDFFRFFLLDHSPRSCLVMLCKNQGKQFTPVKMRQCLIGYAFSKSISWKLPYIE